MENEIVSIVEVSNLDSIVSEINLLSQKVDDLKTLIFVVIVAICVLIGSVYIDKLFHSK